MPTDTGQSYLTTTSTDMPIPSPGATRPPESIPLPERHQAALHHIRALEGHNAKLYQDNCHLASSINKLNDRLAFMGAPQNTQLLRLSDMQEKLRVSDEHRAATERKYQELLQCISAGSGHHHVYVELQSSRDAYASLDREYRLLREKYVRLKAVADTSRTAHHQSQGSRACSPQSCQPRVLIPFRLTCSTGSRPDTASRGRLTRDIPPGASSQTLRSSVPKINPSPTLHHPHLQYPLGPFGPLRITMEIIGDVAPRASWPRFVASSSLSAPCLFLSLVSASLRPDFCTLCLVRASPHSATKRIPAWIRHPCPCVCARWVPPPSISCTDDSRPTQLVWAAFCDSIPPYRTGRYCRSTSSALCRDRGCGQR